MSQEENNPGNQGQDLQETKPPFPGMEKVCQGWENFTGQTLQRLEGLETQFNQKILRDTILKEAFDKLYEEMKQYKEDFLFEAMRPILADLLLLHDNVIRFQKIVEDAKAKDAMASIKEEILEILYRRDVEPMLLSENAKVDRKTQRAVKTLATDIPSEDGNVVEVVREGFYRGNKVFRPQDVVCKKCRACTEEPLRNKE